MKVVVQPREAGPRIHLPVSIVIDKSESTGDIRDLLNATVQLRDGKKVTEMDANLLEKLAFKALMGKAAGTDIEKLLKEYKVI